MNLRKIWKELFQKPTGRLILFLAAGALIIAFLLSGRSRHPTQRVSPIIPPQATAAKSYTFTENIPVMLPSQPVRQEEPAKSIDRTLSIAPPPKPLPAIPQAIFATREHPHSDFFLPYGRMLRCELVNTVDSTSIDTPIIGLVIEDVWQGGRLVIPAGTEVHGVARKVATRERIGSQHQWVIVFEDGRELPLSGTVLDYAPDGSNPDSWGETDGSAGLRGYMIASDKYAEAKAILASTVSAGAGALPSMTNIISPLTGSVTQVQSGGFQNAIAAGIEAGGQIYSRRLLEGREKDPYYVRVPAGTLFYLYVTQTVNLAQTTTGISVAHPKSPQK